MILTWIFGILLIGSLGVQALYELWVILKGILVLLLTHYHFYLGKCVRTICKVDQNKKTSKFFRVINEVPTLLLILIVFIVVLSLSRLEIT